MVRSRVEGILSRLEQAEDHEPNPHSQDDYRIAWITVLYAARGVRQAHVAASYAVLGLHPNRVWPAIVARRRAQLGRYYNDFYGEKSPVPAKKPVESVRLPHPEKDGRKTA